MDNKRQKVLSEVPDLYEASSGSSIDEDSDRSSEYEEEDRQNMEESRKSAVPTKDHHNRELSLAERLNLLNQASSEGEEFDGKKVRKLKRSNSSPSDDINTNHHLGRKSKNAPAEMASNRPVRRYMHLDISFINIHQLVDF
jgi:hypothetical protein